MSRVAGGTGFSSAVVVGRCFLDSWVILISVQGSSIFFHKDDPSSLVLLVALGVIVVRIRTIHRESLVSCWVVRLDAVAITFAEDVKVDGALIPMKKAVTDSKESLALG